MMNIYIVTDGCYSDKTIVGALDTREKAEKFISKFCTDEGRIIEIELNKFEKHLYDNKYRYVVEILFGWHIERCYKPDMEETDLYYENINKNSKLLKNIVVFAEDDNEAKKIAKEKWFEMVALIKWVNNAEKAD